MTVSRSRPVQRPARLRGRSAVVFNIAASVYGSLLVSRVMRSGLTRASVASLVVAGAALVLVGAWLSRRGARADDGAPVA